MKKTAFFCFLLAAAAFAGIVRQETPENTFIPMIDTIYVDSTETEYSKFYWPSKGTYASLLIQAFDDSVAGRADTGASVSIRMLQGFPLNNKEIVVLESDYNPDTLSMSAYSVRYWIADSLEASGMDTSAIWNRNVSDYRRGLNNDTLGAIYGDKLSALGTQSGAWRYVAIQPDYSQAVIFKLTGLSKNQKKGTGSRWILRVFQEQGSPVKSK